MARQLNIGDPSILADYRELQVRWKHTSEIRRRYGYRDFGSQPAHFSLLLWLYRQAWADDVGPSALFRAAHRRLLAEQILLPGANVLARLVGSVRERATRRLWARLAPVASPELVERLEGLLVVPEGKRRSELDRLRRPPFSPTITGLVQPCTDPRHRPGSLTSSRAGLKDVKIHEQRDDSWRETRRYVGPRR